MAAAKKKKKVVKKKATKKATKKLTKPKPRKGKKYTKLERQEIIIQRIKDYGWNGFGKDALAKELGISRPVFYKDVAEIWTRISKEDIRHEAMNVKFIFDQMEDILKKRLLRLMDDPEAKASDIVLICAELRKQQESKAKVYHAFGLVDILADELNINLSADAKFWADTYEAVHGKKPK